MDARSGLTRRTALGVPVLLMAVVVFSFGARTTSGASTATISGSFSDSCRDFTAQSSKDISHVVIHYAGGSIVKDESTTTRSYSIDGGASDEIDSIDVKSGRTSETFSCPATENPPTALLERRAGNFDPRNAPGTWTSDDCIWPDCFYTVPDVGSPFPDESVVTFRGVSSSDTDNDIVTWSLDFGDGTPPAGGSWLTDPPVEVAHDYEAAASCMCTATLTVADSAGQTSSDPIVVSVLVTDTND